MCCEDMPREMICIELQPGQPAAQLAVPGTHSFSAVLGRAGASAPHLVHDEHVRVQWEAFSIPSNACIQQLGMPSLEEGEISGPIPIVVGRHSEEAPSRISTWLTCWQVMFKHEASMYIFDSAQWRHSLVTWFASESPDQLRDIDMVLRVSWVTPSWYPPGAQAELPSGEFLFLHLDARDWSDAQVRIGPDPNRMEPAPLPWFGRRNQHVGELLP
jgi:hypothetical protein